MSETATTRKPETQPDLPGLAEAFKAIGLESLPLGVTRLTRRQTRWCLEFLRTGNASEAARRAGYSSPTSDGSKVHRNAAVSSFLAQAAGPVAKEATQLIIRVAERSKALHAMLRAEWEKPDERQSTKRITQLAAAVNRTDALLGALNSVGRLSGVHVTGDLAHTHSHQGEVALTVPETALPVLAQMKREAALGATSRN